MAQLADSWSKTEALLTRALEQLGASHNSVPDRSSRKLHGSREEAMLFLEHNEYELAWEALAAVGKRERSPYAFWRYLLEAAEIMNLPQEKVDTFLRGIFSASQRISAAFTGPVRVYVSIADQPEQIERLRHIFNRRAMQRTSVLPGARAFGDDFLWSVTIETDVAEFLSWFFGDTRLSMRRFVSALRKTGDGERFQRATITLRDERSYTVAVLYSAETFDIPEAGYHKLGEANWSSLHQRGVRLRYDQGKQQWIDADAPARALA